MFVGRSQQSITTKTTTTTTTTRSNATTTASTRRTPQRVLPWLRPFSFTLLLLCAQFGQVAWGMSIDRLAMERNELQQTPQATAASSARDNVLVDDMRLTAVSAGPDTDMYMLVPASMAAGSVQHIDAAVNHNSIEHGNVIDIDGSEVADEDAATDGGGPQSDMLMLESDNTPAIMQVIKLPSYINHAANEAAEQLPIEEKSQTVDNETMKRYTMPPVEAALHGVKQPQQQSDVENVAELVPQILATTETDAEADVVAATTDASITNADNGETNSSAEMHGIEQTTEQKQSNIGSQEAQVENAASVAEAATEAPQSDISHSASDRQAEVTIDEENIAETVTDSIEEAVEPPNAEIEAKPPMASTMHADRLAEHSSNHIETPSIISKDDTDDNMTILTADLTTVSTKLINEADHVDVAIAPKDDFAADIEHTAISQESEHIVADNTKSETIIKESPIKDIFQSQAQAEQMPVLVLAQSDKSAAAPATEFAIAAQHSTSLETIEQAAAAAAADASLHSTNLENLDKAILTNAAGAGADAVAGTTTIDMPISKQQVAEVIDETTLTEHKQHPAEQIEIQDPVAVISNTHKIQMDDEDLQKTQQQQQQPQQQEPEQPETMDATHATGISILSTILQAPLGHTSMATSTASLSPMSMPNYTNTATYDDTQLQQSAVLQPHADNGTVKSSTALLNSHLRRYDGAQVWRIVVQTDKDKRMADELQTKYDAQLWKEVKQEVDYLLKPQVLGDAEKHIRAANLSRTVLIDNLQQVIEVENPPAEEIAQLQNRKGHRLTWQAYHRLEDIHGFVDYMAKTYPDICTVETIGYSVQKRPLKILKISNGNASNPSIWLDGGMHAREWISPATVTYIANQLIEGWEDLPDNMRNINWYLHPVANPDGYEYSHTTDRLWRKNMRSHGRQCPGVDLNRNFGYKWGGKGTSASPCSQTYRGSKAFSEPETFYISKFISSYPRETFQAYLSFHSYGQYILYPWGYDYHLTQDRSDLDRVARQAGTSITKLTGVKYTVGSSATTLYPAAGGSDDWAKGIAGIKYSYTIEMGDTGRYGFVLPAKFIHYNGKDGYTFVETVARAIMPQSQQDRKLTF